MGFDIAKVEKLYPGAGPFMQEAMLIWKLPAGKENKMSEVCSNGEYFAEEKIDGAWYQFTKGTGGQEYLFGRTTSRVTGLMTEKGQNVPHILSALNCLPNGTALIGEVYFDGGTARDTVTITGCLPQEAVRRQNNPKGKGLIKYYVHDIIFYDGENLMGTGAFDRYAILQAIWQKYELSKFPFLRLATIVETGIEEEVSRILAAGGEGMVLKKRDAVYSPGKRPAWSAIKFKQMDSEDLVCTRTIAPTKEYTGKELDTWQYWGRMTYIFNETTKEGVPCEVISCCGPTDDSDEWYPITKPYALKWPSAIGIGAYDDNGELKEIGTISSGLTDADKQAMADNPDAFIGKVMHCYGMSRDRKEQTFRHFSFGGWRDDKDAKDCKLSEIFGS